MQRPWGWEHPGASPSCCSSSSSRGRSFTAPDRTVPLPARLPVTEPRPVEEGRTQPVAPARAQSEPRGAGARGPLGRSTATAAGMRAGPGPPPRPQSKHGGARRHRVVLRPTGAPCGGSSGRVPLPVGTPTGRARQRGPVSPGAAVRAAVPFPPAMKGRGRGRGAGVARLQQRLGDATQENARLRLSLLRSEAGVSQLQAELERLREDLCRRAQRRRREQQALRELSEEHLAFTSYVRMLQSTNGILRESNRSLRSALLLGSWRGPGAVWGDSSLCPCLPTTGPRQSSASSVDTASPHDAGSWSSEDACSASPGQGTQDPQAGEVERCCHPAQHCCKRKLSAFAPEGSGIGEQPTAPNPVYRLMLAGDSGAGKSSFLLRLCRNEFRGDISSTLGVDFQVKQLLVDGEQTTLQIWDTAGQERPTACCSSTTSAPRAASSASASGSRTSRAPGPCCRSCWWATRATCGPACRRRRGSAQPRDRGWLWPTTASSARPAPRTARTWWRPCCILPGEQHCGQGAPHGPGAAGPGDAAPRPRRAVKRTAASGSGARLDLSIPPPRTAAGCCRA
ncbi:ras-related protein Rab-44-like isoform X9 [Numida meleagris]|uniref:ras-related protein Rab-44-like isoform X9 n=1 Tax=Numida meleagris TaxID=8996 RepID=UPI000B3D8ED9|nr:ras-related protein Rab-44-like isoform X9 [Numida meleagris]